MGPEVKRNPDAPASKWGALKSKLKGTGRPNLSLIAAAALAAKNAAAAGNNTDGATAGSGATSQRGSINGGSDTDDLAIDAHEVRLAFLYFYLHIC